MYDNNDRTMAKKEILSVRTPDGLKGELEDAAKIKYPSKKKHGALSMHVIDVLEQSVKKNKKKLSK